MTGNTGPVFFFDQPAVIKRCRNQQDTQSKSFVKRLLTNSDDMRQEDFSNARDANGQDEIQTAEIKESLHLQREGYVDQEINPEMIEKQNESSMIEEYKRAAPQMLADLGLLLCRYAQWGEDVFPRGLINILNYTWRELTADVHYKTITPSHPDIKQQKEKKPSLSLRKKRSKIQTKLVENELMENVDRPTNIKQTLSINGCTAPGPQVSTTIGFTVSSQSCKEQEWIIQPPDATPIDSDWTSLYQWVVDRLQQAQKPLAESVKSALLLRHYGDSKKVHQNKSNTNNIKQLAVHNGPPRVPVLRFETAPLQKLHYRVHDGTSVIYYPSGQVAVCQIPSGLSIGGFYTNVYSDTSPACVLATVTAFGHGTVSWPQSGVIYAAWNQTGGMILDPTGKVTKKWNWCPDKRPVETVLIEAGDEGEHWTCRVTLGDPADQIAVTEGISVKLCSATSAKLMFRAKNETVHLYLPFLSDVDNHNQQIVKMSSQPSEALQVEQECLEDPSRLHLQGICPLLELNRLRRKARHILEKWLQHYKVLTGTCDLDTRNSQPLCQQSLRQKTQSVPLPSLGNCLLNHRSSAQPYRGAGRGHTTTRHVYAPVNHLAPSSLKMKCRMAQMKPLKEDPQHVTDTGTIRVHSNIKLDSVLVPWFPANWHPSPIPHDPFGSAIACPVVLRAALRGEENWQWWRCGCKQIPVLTDAEYDAFIAGQGSYSEQILVVCITTAQNVPSSPSLSRDNLEQLYRKMNRKRNMPCTQCQMDSFRLLRYEVPGPETHMEPHKTLLQHRHNVAHGMFMMYLRGKLLFVNYILTGDGYSRDLQNQVAKCRRDNRLGQFLPPDFKFSTQLSSGTAPAESSNPGPRDETCAEGGLCGNQSPGIHMPSARENVSGSDRSRGHSMQFTLQ